MLPLEGIFFIPSLVVTPSAIAALLFLKKRRNYPRVWRYAVIACVVLTALYTVVTLSTPLYSERDHSPDNPGGFSVSLWAVIGEFIFWTCVVIPAFPVLLALAVLPPGGRARLLPAVFSLLVVIVFAALIARKNAVYMADYRMEKSKPRRTPFERFEHLRENPGGAADEK